MFRSINRIIRFTKCWINSRSRRLAGSTIYSLLRKKSFLFAGSYPAGGYPQPPFFARQSLAIFLLSSARRKKQRSIHPLQGLPLYGEDATAPPVALTLRYPRPIKGSGCFLSTTLNAGRLCERYGCGSSITLIIYTLLETFLRPDGSKRPEVERGTSEQVRAHKAFALKGES